MLVYSANEASQAVAQQAAALLTASLTCHSAGASSPLTGVVKRDASICNSGPTSASVPPILIENGATLFA